MNTILIDDERRAMVNEWALNGDTLGGLLRKVEAAVLAKLREQEPIGYVHPQAAERLKRGETVAFRKASYGEERQIPVYAAPQPAVVPPGYKLVPVEPTREMVRAGARCASSNMCWAEMLAAAPEAPAVVQVPQAEQAAEAVRVTEFNVGRWCLSEDDCIAEGIDFSSYERGVADAASAFGKNVAAAPPPAVVHVPQGLKKRCAEILDWQKTGVLKGDELRGFAVVKFGHDSYALQQAEAETAWEAYRLIAAAPEAPAQAVSEREAFEAHEQAKYKYPNDGLTRYPDAPDQYALPLMQARWEGWQARAKAAALARLDALGGGE